MQVDQLVIPRFVDIDGVQGVFDPQVDQGFVNALLSAPAVKAVIHTFDALLGGADGAKRLHMDQGLDFQKGFLIHPLNAFQIIDTFQVAAIGEVVIDFLRQLRGNRQLFYLLQGGVVDIQPLLRRIDLRRRPQGRPECYLYKNKS